MPRSISQQLTTFRLDQPGLAHVVDTQRQQDSMLRQLIDVQSQLIQNQQVQNFQMMMMMMMMMMQQTIFPFIIQND